MMVSSAYLYPLLVHNNRCLLSRRSGTRLWMRTRALRDLQYKLCK